MADPCLDVLVVGAGLVGSAAALGLHQRGYSVGLLERREPHNFKGRLGFDPRMLAIAPKWRALAESLGESAWQHQGEFRRLVAWEELGTAEVSFSAEEAGVPCLGYMASMSELQSRLWKLVCDNDIKVFLGEDIEDIQVSFDRVTLHTTRPVSARLLIGADGANSRVRSLLGRDRQLRPTGQTALVTVAEVSEHHAHTAWQRFLRDGPLALLPLTTGDERCCVSIVWSQSSHEATRRAALDESAFCEELAVASERRLGEVLTCDERYPVPLEQQVSETFAPGSRTLLLGDSARVIHPLAGQGANLGFEDVAAVFAVLDAHHADPGADSLWRQFSQVRRIRARAVVAAMEFFLRVYAVEDPTFGWLRNIGVRFVDRADFIKQILLREALGDSLLLRIADRVNRAF